MSLHLPRAPDVTPTSDRPCEDALTQGSARVLVVEDNVDVQDVACTLLENLGYHVGLQTVATARQALDALAGDSDVDLIFSDIVMPGQDQWRRSCQARASAISGYRRAADERRRADANRSRHRFFAAAQTLPYRRPIRWRIAEALASRRSERHGETDHAATRPSR